MLGTSNNILVQVQTYQKGMLAYQSNYGCFASTANTRFKNFQDQIPSNLGDSVSFDKPYKFVTTRGLIANPQPIEQRQQTLTCSESANIAVPISAQQWIFTLDEFMTSIGEGCVQEIGSEVESDIAQVCVTNTTRYYGDGVNPISQYSQLPQMLATFRNIGMPRKDTKVYLSDMTIPPLAADAQTKFVPSRNEKIAADWMIGGFDDAEFYRSNLLPVHDAGNVGNAGSVLTVVSVVKNSANQITSITFSGAPNASDPDAVKQYDKFTFKDGVSGQTNVRLTTFYGHKPSQAQAQFQAAADAASNGSSNVTITVDPPLQAAAGKNQNISTEIVAGMQVTSLPTARYGLITAGNPLYVAMPMLPDQQPFPTAVGQDPDMGISTRLTTGALLGQNVNETIYDLIWGKTLVSDYAMAVVQPY
jgi:hypothetical protein